MHKAYISGIGSYLPERRLTNADLEQMVDTTDEWIVTRTGISERRIAAQDEATSDLAFYAAKAALANAALQADQIDLLIVATSTPDYQFPPVACQVQQRLGCRQIGAFDVGATCIGFLSALEIANQYVTTGKHQHVLVIGADTLSRVTDYTDRSTCILFGDGAGAVVLSRAGQDKAGIIHTAIHAEGEHFSSLYVPNSGSRLSQTDDAERGKILMDGKKIFKLAVSSMTKTVEETLQNAGYSKEDLDWVIPHQANQRIIEAVAKNLDFPMEKVVSTIKGHGNNSAATLPVALDIAMRQGKVERGQLIMLTAFGAGLVWGSLLLRL